MCTNLKKRSRLVIIISLIVILMMTGLTFPVMATNPPIALNSTNPHYFTFRGEPTILVTSGEHYGAVMNLDFDYIPYLDELQSRGLNLTRLFAGSYVENQGWYNYPATQSLSPTSGALIAPWARSTTPGYINGGNKFDLNEFDPVYFTRLKDFITEAGDRGIVVEVVLFCSYYDDTLWQYSPMHINNNINNIGNCDRNAATSLNNGGLLAVQDDYIEKIVTELEDYDNIYYEVCNEPYFKNVPRDWQDHVIQKIVDTESSFTYKHLIAENIKNYSSDVTNPNPNVSVFNWHYAYGDGQTLTGDIASLNYDLNKPLSNDETGMTTNNNFYRKEGWETIIAGCAVYDNLDLSFLVNDETGSTPPTLVNGGGPALRSQLSILKDFIYDFDFIDMHPDNSVITGGVPSGARARALVQDGNQYAVYIRGGSGVANLAVTLPGGTYEAKWLNTVTGNYDKTETFTHAGGSKTIVSPSYSSDIALSIKAAIPSPETTVTFQQGVNSYAGTADAHLLQANGYTNRNTGGNSGFEVGKFNGSVATDNKNGLLRFDVSSIPAGATITSATVELTLNSCRNGTPNKNVEVHKVNTAWGEGTKTGIDGAAATSGECAWDYSAYNTAWAAVGGDYDAAVADTETIGSTAGDKYNWNITSMVQGWVTAPSTNKGMLFRVNNDTLTGTKVFDSKESSTAGNRPKLTVTYTTAPAPTTVTLQQGVNSYAGTADAHLLQANGYTNRNTGGNSGFEVGKFNGSVATDNKNGLLRFDVSSIPAGATITSATVELTLNSCRNGTPNKNVEVHKVNTAWGEGTKTGIDGAAATSGECAWAYSSYNTAWAAAGGDYDAAVAGTETIGSTAGAKYNWDITSMVQGWVTAPSTNKGMLFRVDNDTLTGTKVFESKECSTVENRPKLTVTYTN